MYEDSATLSFHRYHDISEGKGLGVFPREFIATKVPITCSLLKDRLVEMQITSYCTRSQVKVLMNQIH
jgi:hypothetical protein